MRFCEGENVEVYEAHGPSLSTLLRDVAGELDIREDLGYVNLTVQYDYDGEYNVVVYLH